MDVVAIGNGTACRETEVAVSSLLNQFPHVSYVIVDESGASIYRFVPTPLLAQPMHYGTKPGDFETSKIHFPTSERTSEWPSTYVLIFC